MLSWILLPLKNHSLASWTCYPQQVVEVDVYKTRLVDVFIGAWTNFTTLKEQYSHDLSSKKHQLMHCHNRVSIWRFRPSFEYLTYLLYNPLIIIEFYLSIWHSSLYLHVYCLVPTPCWVYSLYCPCLISSTFWVLSVYFLAF